MQQLSPKDIDHIAHLARISLTDEEKKVFAAQLSQILEYVAQLQEIDTTNVPVFQHERVKRIARADKVVAWEDTAALLAAAPKTRDRYVEVPKVLQK